MRISLANTKTFPELSKVRRSSPPPLAFKRDFTQSSRRSLSRDDDQKEDPALMDDLETEATGRPIEDGINEVIDYSGEVSRKGTWKDATEEGKLKGEDDEARGSGRGETETEGETSGMGTDDLLDGPCGGDGGDIGIGDIIGEVGGLVDF